MLRFFHLADFHLGVEFDSHSPALRQTLRRDMRQAFQDMVARAISEQIDGLLIAGDLLDDSSIDPRNEIFLLQQLKRLTDASIPVFLVQGNHDFRHRLTPESVHILGSELDVIDQPDYRIVGQSFERQFDLRTIQDLPTFADEKPTIGVFHTQIVSHHEGDRSSYLASTVDALEASGYDYIALGHVHERAVYGSRKNIQYPGSFFPLSKNEVGRRGYLDVRLTPSLKVQFIPSSRTVFARIDAELMSGDDFRVRTYDQLKALHKPDQISQIRLEGFLQPTELQDLPEILEMIEDESDQMIDFIDRTQLAPLGDLTQNPFFQQLLENFDSKVFARIDRTPMHQMTSQEYRLWYAKNKDRVRRLLLASFYKRGQV